MEEEEEAEGFWAVIETDHMSQDIKALTKR